MSGGSGMAAIGLVMHFAVALTATLVFYALSRRLAVLRTRAALDHWSALRRDCLLRHELRDPAGAVLACAASTCTRRRGGPARWAGRSC